MQKYLILWKPNIFKKSIPIFECFEFELAFLMLEDYKNSTLIKGYFKLKIEEGVI